MRITYKKNLYYDVEQLIKTSNFELIYKSIIERKEVLGKLDLLYKSNDDLEFLSRFNEIFNFWPYKEDYNKICSNVLGTEDYLVSKLNTDMVVMQEEFVDDDIGYLPFIYYWECNVAHCRDLDLSKKYTKKELLELIKDNKIVLLNFGLGSEYKSNESSVETVGELSKMPLKRGITDEFDFEFLKNQSPKLFYAILSLIKETLDYTKMDELTTELYESLYSDLEIIRNVVDSMVDDLNNKKEDYEYVKQKSYQLIKSN